MSNLAQILEGFEANLIRLKQELELIEAEKLKKALSLGEVEKLEDADIESLKQAYAALGRIIDEREKKVEVTLARDIKVSKPLELKNNPFKSQ